ncbi:hypothetical protein [Sphingomonas abietis]|uniref:Beta/gamma crystallin 'Greek key' domain-containing protein n=1 Tax=Sphingomonas abietis TaxID=3012344 RepID=A0ABY7NJ86_9SPHN|nr:hypothetical protein [Sphingomonas abietis]WBO21050.1 hypothetical protein PBT88_12635 [Sphingomonas abietis]
MITLALAAYLFGTTAAPASPSKGAGAGSAEFAELRITQSLVIRVPARRSRRYAGPDMAPPPAAFKEHKGPKCIDAATIGGAAVTSQDRVDFILKGGKRVRAVLENECPALDYYSGFYFQAPADGKLCADRDSIHTRSGGDCQIDKFRALTPISPGK